jgi:hypothetical protein
MEWVWLFSAAAGGDVQSGQPGLGFLGLGPFSRETLVLRVGKAWISLDSLVRIERYQWVTLDFR